MVTISRANADTRQPHKPKNKKGPLLTKITEKPIGILGLGTCVPERVLTNEELARMVDTSDEWITTRTGIKERRILAEGQVPTDLSTKAVERAIEDSGIDPGEIGAIINATYIPDHQLPPTACLIQSKMKLPSSMCFDLNGACTGWLYGIQTAHALIRTGHVKKALVIGCDCNSRVVDWTDRQTCVLFGDGAGAVIVGETEEGRGILGNHAGSDGSGAGYIIQRIGGGAHPLTAENILSTERYMKMNGREVFKFAVRIFNDAVLKALDDAGLTIDDVDLFVPHQANVRIINAAMEKFGFERERVIINMDRYGNTSAASIPLALGTAREEGKLTAGKTCALVAFGAGLTYAATILKW